MDQQPSTSNDYQPCFDSTVMTPEEQSFFAFDDIVIMPCNELEAQTEDIEPQLYLQSLESRVAKALNSSKGFTDLVQIAEAYNDDSKVNIRLNTTPVKSSEFDELITGMERKGCAKVETPLGDFEVPIPTASAIPKYQRALNNAAAASIKTLADTSLLMCKAGVDVSKTAANVKRICSDVISKCVKKVERRDVMESILSVMMIERLKDRQLQSICDQYSKPEMWVDPLTAGLWIVDPDSNHPAVKAARTRKVTSIYEFDDHQTQSLIALAFSKKPRETAAAKLNLFSKVKGSKRDDIKSDPRKVLATVLSESELNQSEVKAILFTKPKEGMTACPSCDVPVEIDGVTYHGNCEVIQWLVKNFFFKYDEEMGVLSQQRVVFLDQNQRAMLEYIQKHHRTLNQPFKIKSGAKYALMQRDGEQIRTLTQLNTNPVFVPGTEEWLEAQKRK